MNFSLWIMVAIVSREFLQHHTLVEDLSLPSEKQWTCICSHEGGQLPPQGGDRHKGIDVLTTPTRVLALIFSRVRVMTSNRSTGSDSLCDNEHTTASL
jgi:hypothetical protein